MAPHQALASLTNSEPDVLGRVEPRIWTPPLRELTPETSFGYDLIDFAEAIGFPFEPWQKWLAIHIGELLPDGRPRFRFVLALVARQNGKTTFVQVLTAYWMYIDRVPLVLGTSTDRRTAKESWTKVVELVEGSEILMEETDPNHKRDTTGEEAFWNAHGSRYLFAAPNRRAGRSFTVHRLVLDELREHSNRDTWDASVGAMNAVPDAQAIAITNQGDITSIVLDEERDAAIEYIETGNGDPRVGLFEWSSPNGADPTDPEALAMANPDLNRSGRVVLDNLVGAAMRAKRAGGETLARFRTEYMCQRVTLLNPAIDPDSWRDSGTEEPIDLAAHRRRLALGLDVSLDGSHATLVAAVHLDGITHVEVVHRWYGFGCTKALRAELPGLVAKLRPRTMGWLPGGPAAAVAAGLAKRPGWPPRRVDVEEIRAEVPAVCMGLAEQVLTGQVQHPNDEMLTQHVMQTQKLNRGEAQWVFTRRGDKPIDGTYALAVAVHLARTVKVLAPVTGA